jgi:DMSO/TMAO reductase YedYZ molybdopterin-dependent catalytic subunit
MGAFKSALNITLKAGRIGRMDTKSVWVNKSHRGFCKVLSVMAVAALLLTPMILTGETIGKPLANPFTMIASASREEPGANSDADEEIVDDVYEATKNLHETGITQDVNVFNWRLDVEGDKVGKPISLSYRKLENMEMVKKEVVLVCPGVFTDTAEWEGVPLLNILEMAQVEDDYKKVYIHGLDGYRSVLDKEAIDHHLIFLALKVNGVTLPKEHGYPVRLVAEDISGGKWVKWIDSIEVK